MAGDFRIAEGFVEVTVRPSREQLHAAAQQAVDEFETTTRTGFREAGSHAGSEFATGAHATLGAGLEHAGDGIGDRVGADFAAHVEGRLRDAKGRFVRVGEDLGKDILGGLTGGTSGGGGSGGISGGGFIDRLSSAFGTLQQAGSQAFADLKQGASQVSDALGTLGDAAGIAWNILKYVGAPAAAIELIPPLLDAIIGGLASIPALATGAGLALATLAIGTQGIGAAIGQVFNPTGGGGGGASSRLDQLASAERNLASAERSEQEAQQALTEARVQAAFHLQDLNLQMERQQENQQSAALAILEAQQALIQAQASGDQLAIARAQLNLQEAVTGLKEQKQQTVELAYEKQQADAKGVEGSDQVVSALDRVTAASNAVIDAQNAVKQASISAAAGAVTAYSKLSPEAKKFVDEIARLKPELVGLQQYVQDRLFVGLDRKLDVWAHVWIPQLRHDLGELAGDANTFSKRLGDDLSKPEIVSAVRGVADAMDRVFNRFTTGGALDKLVTAMGDLVTKATPFIEGLANSAIDKLADWADKLDKAAKDGDLETFFKDASKDLHDIWDIGSDVWSILSDIIDVVSGQDTKLNDGKTGLEQLKDALDGIKKWAESDKGKQTIKDIADAFILVGQSIWFVLSWVGRIFQWLDEGVHQTKSDIHGLTSTFDTLRDDVVIAMQGLVRGVTGAFGQILDAAANAFSWVPGIGGKLQDSKNDFDRWVKSVNTSLDGLKTPRTIQVQLVGSFAGDIVSWLNQKRWGGVRYAEDGLVSLGNRSAGVYQQGPLYGFAEPDTGGELFMPRNGDPARNRDLARVAAQWAGLDTTPARSPIAAGIGAGASHAGGSQTLQPVQIHVGGEHLVDLVLGVVAGNPTVVSAAAAKGDRSRSFTQSART